MWLIYLPCLGCGTRSPWASRWSLSGDALETIIQVARRKDVAELDRLWRTLLDAYKLEGPIY
jgi:hypothetical protein